MSFFFRGGTPESVTTTSGSEAFHDAPQQPVGGDAAPPLNAPAVSSTHVGAAPAIDGAFSYQGDTLPWQAGAPHMGDAQHQGAPSANAYDPRSDAPAHDEQQKPSTPFSHFPVSDEEQRGSVAPLFGSSGPPPAEGLRGNVPVTRADLEQGPFSHGAVRGGLGNPEAQGLRVVDDDSEKTVNQSQMPASDSARDLEKGDEKGEAPAAAAPAGPKPMVPDEHGRIIVRWDGLQDKEHAQNLPFWYRIYLTILGGLMTLATAFTSSGPSFLMPQIMQEFHQKQEVVLASTFLFVGGFCFAPLFWAPMSESFGHKWTFVAAMVGFTAFNIGCAFAPNIGALIVFRLLAGAFGSAPMSNVAPMIAGLFSMKYLLRGIALFAVAPMAGPCIGPIVGGYIEQAHANWRWIFRVSAMVSFFFVLATVFTMVETSDAVRLKYKAQRLRRETGDDRYVAPIEVRERQSPLTLLRNILVKPVKLFFLEPMLIAVTLYISFVYGTLYLLFEAYPYVFMTLHHMKPGSVGLTFLGYFVGTVFGGAWASFVDNARYLRLVKQNGGKPPAPEARLRMALVGAPLLVISLFWFAWTSYEKVSYWSPLIAGGVYGMAQYLIFLGLMVYITEVYLFSAASAIAANTVVRSAFGVGFPMFAGPMYRNLGANWATTILAFIALALFPIPFVLIRLGKKLRSMSRFAHTMDLK
ncbi:hypothetical protein MOBT1_002407 [Malassezia obtusa]|uniref:Major facilitator superfamily (MFS) profile domain-containing protein n=1 Tax=Malassezia obtusa TaxID=76774 RepID=A0AAF0DZW6_9BASI|nr:hypothetical protein MOBT1_002407 [Malassezia obtusa]